MRALFQKLHEVLAAHRPAVLVRVIASSGSTPRGAGAHMLVTGEGRSYGTVGGGAVEHACEKEAEKVLKSGSSRMESFQLRQNEIRDLGMICGGNVRVYFQYISAGDPGVLALTEHIEALFREADPAYWITDITEGGSGEMGIYQEKGGAFGMAIPDALSAQLSGGTAAQLEWEGRRFFCEALMESGVVYIFGGGHVSQALVPVLRPLQFRCVVLEDREAFCSPALFPGAEKTCLIDIRRIADFITVTESDYAVIMTRGHKDDQAVEAQLLHTPARYIGVIGSRRKSAMVFANLREMGFSDEELARIKTPIGLDIGAETPEEIAISIAGELIRVRRRGK